MQPAVEHGQHLRGRKFVVDAEFAQHADGERAIECCSCAFARDVAQSKRQTSFTIGKKVVEIAA